MPVLRINTWWCQFEGLYTLLAILFLTVMPLLRFNTADMYSCFMEKKHFFFSHASYPEVSHLPLTMCFCVFNQDDIIRKNIWLIMWIFYLAIPTCTQVCFSTHEFVFLPTCLFIDTQVCFSTHQFEFLHKSVFFYKRAVVFWNLPGSLGACVNTKGTLHWQCKVHWCNTYGSQ